MSEYMDELSAKLAGKVVFNVEDREENNGNGVTRINFTDGTWADVRGQEIYNGLDTEWTLWDEEIL